jgi:NAD(P)H-hydrate epimerase
MVELTGEHVASLLPTHSENAHKYSVGTLLCVTGSEGMTGAAILCAKGALLSGAGLVYQASPKGALNVLQSALYEPVFLESDQSLVREYLKKAKAVVFGCGLEKNSHNVRLLEYILNEDLKQGGYYGYSGRKQIKEELYRKNRET